MLECKIIIDLTTTFSIFNQTELNITLLLIFKTVTLILWQHIDKSDGVCLKPRTYFLIFKLVLKRLLVLN